MVPAVLWEFGVNQGSRRSCDMSSRALLMCLTVGQAHSCRSSQGFPQPASSFNQPSFTCKLVQYRGSKYQWHFSLFERVIYRTVSSLSCWYLTVWCLTSSARGCVLMLNWNRESTDSYGNLHGVKVVKVQVLFTTLWICLSKKHSNQLSSFSGPLPFSSPSHYLKADWVWILRVANHPLLPVSFCCANLSFHSEMPQWLMSGRFQGAWA